MSKIPLFPPKRYEHLSMCHWVERLDYDGRSTGLVVKQWQSTSKTWCSPNEHAAGNHETLEGYVWLGVCPYPFHQEEYDEFEEVLEMIKSGADFEMIPETKKEAFLRMLSELIYNPKKD